ncbi:MAG: T9SS type A sorting domain-containing protein [Ignavibacteriales bacterium]|nr:T9SS type A sorting domain-containing protein [Ignavibacteriales bacterium]
MIGCPTEIVPFNSIASIPGGIITSNFFGYDGSTYKKVDTLKPGYGYWVKVTQAGQLILKNSSSLSMLSLSKIRPTPEMPQLPPDGDKILNIKNRISNFALEQNYPNPFNPSTTIHFKLPKESQVTLKVYYMLGQEVLKVLDEEKTAGRYDIKIDGTSLASGVLFYRLVAGNYVSTKKFVLLK